MLNRLRVCSSLMIILALLFTGGSAHAESSVAERIANQQNLRASVQSGEGKFARLKAADKSRLLGAQDTIFAVLEGKKVSTELTREEVRRIESAESEIANIVANLEPTSQRTVRCSYQARLGSNRKERVCRDIKSSGDAEGRAALRKIGQCRGSTGCSGGSTPAG